MTQSLDTFRRAAKKLKRAFRDGDDSARSRVQAVLPGTDNLKHADALHVIATEQGHASWPRFKFAHELASMDRAARAERLKIALYLGQNWIVESLLAADPDLGSDNLGLQCALYDLDGVRSAIAADPEAATRVIGIRSPILHLAFSRHFRAVPERKAEMLGIAEALVAAGADVNDSYPYPDDPESPLPALYGALGHAGNLDLAEWLLEHGANPNDGESLYHATELGNLEGLRLLMRYGVKTRDTNVLNRMLDFDNLEGIRLLLDYGADPNVIGDTKGDPWIDPIPPLHQAARRRRDGRFATLLLGHGADGDAIWRDRSAYARACLYGNESFAEALETAGHATPLTAEEEIIANCAKGIVPADRPLAGVALDDEAALILSEVILWEDRLDQAKALVAAGIDPNRPGGMGMTPLHFAGWAGLPRHTAWLLTLDPDLTHVNDYGGDIIGTIVHGSENRLDVAERDHPACARMVLETGATIRKADLAAMHEGVSAVLNEWAEAHPESVVEADS